MNFIINFRDQTSTALVAPTWSEAAAYAEGTGKEIQGISQLINVTFVLNVVGSDNCYQVSLKNTTTSLLSNYYVFDNDFQSLNTWITSQSNTEVRNISLSQRNYVSI
jgi:hypothetical protein